MAQLLSIDWEPDDLTGVEVNAGDGGVRIRRCFNLVWPESIVPSEDPQAAGEWLATSLKEAGVNSDQTLVVLPREALVVRRLELPNAPDAELPDLVRFQAATKSSTPLERLALDFIPLPVEESAEHRQVLMVTVDGPRLQTVRDVLAAARLDVSAIGISPVAVAELVTRSPGAHSSDAKQATLAIYQDTHRVEITILQQRRVLFSHQTRLTGSDDTSGIRSSIVEINRASVALSQTQHDVEISDVCLIHAGDADPALETALAERFGGQLHVLDVAATSGLRIDKSVDPGHLDAYAPAIGMAFSYDSARVPAIDFLNPRKRVEEPDRTRLKLGLAAAGLLVASGAGYLMFHSHLGSLTDQVAMIESQESELKRNLKAGEPELAAAGNVEEWLSGGRDPLAVLDELRQVSPGTGRLYLKSYEQIGGNRDTAARITGMGYSKSREDVEDLQETLEQEGFRVLPNVTTPSRVDPDYPFEFQLELHILRESTAEESARTG